MTTIKMTKSKLGVFYTGEVDTFVCVEAIRKIWGISSNLINFSISKTNKRERGWYRVKYLFDGLYSWVSVLGSDYPITSQQMFRLKELGIKGDFWVRAEVCLG